MHPCQYALLFNSKIIAAQDSTCPYQWKCADSIEAWLKRFGTPRDHLTHENPEPRSRAAAEVVAWGVSTTAFGVAPNLKLFKDLFGLDPDELNKAWAHEINITPY